MLTITSLASSSAGNAYVLEDAGRRLLLECGIPASHLVAALGHGLTRFDACLVSHEHEDHARAVGAMLAYGVPVLASRGTWVELGAGRPDLRRVLAAGCVEELAGGWSVVPFAVIHDAAEPLGFVIGTPSGESVLFLTDTGEVRHRFHGLTRIMVEANHSDALLAAAVADGTTARGLADRIAANHLSIENVAGLLSVTDLSEVREVHLLHLSDRHSDADVFRDVVAGVCGKPVHVAPRAAYLEVLK